MEHKWCKKKDLGINKHVCNSTIFNCDYRSYYKVGRLAMMGQLLTEHTNEPQ